MINRENKENNMIRHKLQGTTTFMLILIICVLSTFSVKECIGDVDESEVPYQISTKNQLISVGTTPALQNRYVVLIADIDLSGTTWNQAIIPWFEGTFDGNGHSIKNLTIKDNGDPSTFIALFGYLEASAKIQNLNITGAHVSGRSPETSGLAAINYGTILNCSFSGMAQGDSTVGGLVGINFGHVADCQSHGNVKCTDIGYCGGLIGVNNGTVLRCSSTGAVHGGNFTGGLIGSNEGSVIDCNNIGPTMGHTYVGGLLGENNSDVTRCTNKGVVRGESHVGGIIGSSSGDINECSFEGEIIGEGMYIGGLIGSNNGNVTNCNSIGPVIGDHSVGGLIGISSGTINRCSSAGKVHGSSERVGGLIGHSNGDLINSVSNCTISGGDNVGGLVGLMGMHKQVSNCCSKGEVIGIDGVGGLIGFSQSIIHGCFSRSSVIGNCYVGGLVGRGSGISNSYCTGRVRGGSDYVGGLTGDNSGSIINCYSISEVKGDKFVGGLMGINGGDDKTVSSFWCIEASGQATSAGGGMGLTEAGMQDINTYLEAGWDFVNETENGTEDIWWIDEGQGYPRLWWEDVEQ